MINPTRRNKNIGTSKQGHGKNNKLVIPSSTVEMKTFYERLSNYQVVEREINNTFFKFVVEKTRKNSFHSCTIDDLEKIIQNIPKNDYGDLRLIVLRQPTIKQESLNPVFGRLIYSYEFEKDFEPAIIIEANDFRKKFKWGRKLKPDDRIELERLIQDGFEIKQDKRYYTAEYKIESVRRTQLYRTLIHEFGHYFQYQQIVVNPLKKIKKELDEIDKKTDSDNASKRDMDKWSKIFDKYNLEVERLENKYFSIPSQEKERFAHKYADKLKMELESKGLIPFDRIINLKQMEKDKLNIDDFIKKD